MFSVVLLSRNVKTAHSRYYKDLLDLYYYSFPNWVHVHFLSREIIFHGDNASYIRFGETKDKYFNRSLRHGTEMRHRNLRSDSVLVHTGYIDTGALLVPGFGTQP